MLIINTDQTITGDTTNEDGGYVEDDTVDVTVTLPDDVLCLHCGEPVVNYGTEGWVHEGGIGDDELCGPYDQADVDQDPDGDYSCATPQRTATELANWAGINIRDTEVRVQISVGDPRGCLGLTLRRLDDGRLILHVPHQNEAMPHVTLTELHEGTYLVGGTEQQRRDAEHGRDPRSSIYPKTPEDQLRRALLDG